MPLWLIMHDHYSMAIDLADSGRLNRRNTAMSKMAEILGVPNIIAKSG